MTEPDRRLLADFATALRQEFANAQVWAFGSRVSGTFTPESDLDVCVVLERFAPEDRLRISDIAWEVGFRAGILVATVVFTRYEFENGPSSANPMVRGIRERGLAA